jgi:hypothetical protein
MPDLSPFRQAIYDQVMAERAHDPDNEDASDSLGLERERMVAHLTTSDELADLGGMIVDVVLDRHDEASIRDQLIYAFVQGFTLCAAAERVHRQRTQPLTVPEEGP